MRRISFLIAGILIFYTSQALADSLAEIPFSFINSYYGIYGSANLKTYYQPEDSIWPAGAGLFEEIPTNRLNKGDLIVLRSQEDDPEYAAYVSLLTDGRDDILIIRADIEGCVMEISLKESDLFGTIGPWPDLREKEITGVGLRIDDFSLNLSMIWLGFPLFITDVSISGQIIINPEKKFLTHIPLLLLQ